jgi:hypothetical protein
VLKGVDPETPPPVIVEALQHDMRDLVRFSEQGQDWERQRQSQRIEAVSRRVDLLREQQRQAGLDERLVARSLRIAAWGLVIPLLGTGISSIAALLS